MRQRIFKKKRRRKKLTELFLSSFSSHSVQRLFPHIDTFRLTELDNKFPRGPAVAQYPYLKSRFMSSQQFEPLLSFERWTVEYGKRTVKVSR